MQKSSMTNKTSVFKIKNRIQPYTFIASPHLPYPNSIPGFNHFIYKNRKEEQEVVFWLCVCFFFEMEFRSVTQAGVVRHVGQMLFCFSYYCIVILFNLIIEFCGILYLADPSPTHAQ